MTKKRLNELDIIKFIALLAVFTVHFTVELELQGAEPLAQVFPTVIFNAYLGSFGVSLFFVSSGAALMYNYGEKCELKTYYKKRFIGIYPMFWIAFIIATGVQFLLNGGIDRTIPKWKIIFSILGTDGNALWWSQNFYQLGEWFLGVIICLYIIFPLLRAGLNKKPLMTTVIVVIMYVLSVAFFKSTLPTDCFFVTRIPEFFLGMLYIKYRDKFRLASVFLGAAMVAFISLMPSDALCKEIQVPFVGMGSFLVLSYIFSRITLITFFQNICKWASKYCYPFFLVHHWLIINLARRFKGMTLVRSEVWVFYITCFIFSVLLAKGLYMLNQKVLSYFRKDKMTQVKAGS